MRSFVSQIEVGSGVPTSTGIQPRVYLDIDSSILYVKGEGDAGWGPVDASIDGLTASTAELNSLDDSAAFADGLSRVRVASATYDFAVDGGEIGPIDLGVEIPDNAIVLDGMVDVITTLTSATDAATVALSVDNAGDIVAAIAIDDVSAPWDEGLQAIVPLGTAATAVKTTAAGAMAATIAEEAVTAGKFVVILRYVLSA